VRVLVVAVTAALALSACGSDFGAEKGATKQSRDILDLWRPMIVIALCILALVVGLVVWSVVRYRARGRTDAPSQRQYVIPIEVLYTAVPILIVAVIFGLSYKTQTDVDALSDDPDVVIDVQGFQWQWQFHYRGDDITVTGLPGRPPVMVLPVRETVRLNLRSRDVIHSFYVPSFLYKRDVIPGVHNRVDVDVTDAGTYTGFCAEFCGLDHARMTFVVKAVSRAEFRDWLDAHSGKHLQGAA
jgi:cytochrome c oxidase subunit 2